MHTQEPFFTGSLLCAPEAAPKLFGYGPCFQHYGVNSSSAFWGRGRGEGGVGFFLSLARLQELTGVSCVSLA